MKDRAHDDAMAEIFRKDPAYAVELLQRTTSVISQSLFIDNASSSSASLGLGYIHFLSPHSTLKRQP